MTYEEIFRPFIDEFIRLSQLSFSPQREYDIDEFFAGLNKLNFESPTKGDFIDEPTAEIRTRRWTYYSDDGTCFVQFIVVLTLGGAEKTHFESAANFTGT